MPYRDYGADIPCPHCRGLVHLTPRQLQAQLQVVFLCPACGAEVMYDNPVAREIADAMEQIRRGLGKMKI